MYEADLQLQNPSFALKLTWLTISAAEISLDLEYNRSAFFDFRASSQLISSFRYMDLSLKKRNLYKKLLNQLLLFHYAPNLTPET